VPPHTGLCALAMLVKLDAHSTDSSEYDSDQVRYNSFDSHREIVVRFINPAVGVTTPCRSESGSLAKGTWY
jgi:hypothetical protein